MPIQCRPSRKRIRLAPEAYRTGDPFLLTLHAARGTEPFARDRIARCVATRLDLATAASDGCVRAWCLMPNHLHLVIAGAPDVVAWVCTFKSVTTRVAQACGWVGSLWQRSFHDRRLPPDGDSIDRAVDYVVGNPVRAGLVSDPADWPYWRVAPDR